ncbi:MAG: hypothetical protein IGS39_05555 [Calothrix sp. C42_A2020_038]|nr:hypothetical protein [Calothrix sp. C42_A2020_038]
MQNNDFNTSSNGSDGKGNDKAPSCSNKECLNIDFLRRRSDTNAQMNADSYSAMQKVLVELRISKSQGMSEVGASTNSFRFDTAHEPVRVATLGNLAASIMATNQETNIIDGEVEEQEITETKATIADITKFSGVNQTWAA